MSDLDLTWAVVTRNLTVTDIIVIAGHKYRRADLPPEGYEERWAIYIPGEGYRVFDKPDPEQGTVRIYVQKEGEG